MVRVFHIVTHFDLGGAERVALNIASSANAEVEYHVVEVVRANTEYTRTMLDEMHRAGISYHRAHMPSIRFHYVFERLAAALFPFWFLWVFLRWRPDVIHSHTEVPDMAVTAFFRLFPWLRRRCRIVRTIHNTRLWTGLSRTGQLVERFMLSTNGNVAISSAVAQSYAERYGQPGPVVYNGLPELPQRRYSRLRQGCANVLFAGRLEPQKGVNTLIELVESMADDSRFFFHVIGEGALSPLVHQRLGRLQNVELCPPVYGLASMLGSFDFLFMPSEHEGLALLSIEASLAATPTIINRAPGLSETLPEDWPLAVSGNDTTAFVRLFHDLPEGEARAVLGRSAQQFARDHFSIEQMRRGYEAIYLG